MTRREFVNPVPCVLLRLISLTSLPLGLILSFLAFSSHTQAGTVITETTGAGNLGTHVSLPIGHVYGITGGTPVGSNLFHSFAQFDVGTGDIAQFQTTTLIPNAATHNILGRITDANPSVIFGTIDSATYYPNANLFLMNPYGFLFGPNATINIGGMAAFTTANYLQLSDGNHFEAIPGTQDSLLSTFPVAAFGFLGSNPAAISVQGSTLSVNTGQSLALIGGNHGFNYKNPDTSATASVPDGVTMTGGRLLAPNGQITVASVASAGEISAVDFMPTSGMAMGNITLSQGTILDVSGNGGGTVRIRGSQLVMDQSTVIADTIGLTEGASTAISIQADGDLILNNMSSVTARSLGAGNSGSVEVSASNILVTGGSRINTESRATGITGDITLTTEGMLSLTGRGSDGNPSAVQSEGPIGAITISASKVLVDDRAVIRSTTSNAGGAGNITLTVDDLMVTNGAGIVTSGGEFFPSGNIHITASNSISLLGQFDISNLSRIANENGGSGGTGNIVVETKDLMLSGGGRILSDTFFSPSPPEGPKVLVTATNSASIAHGSDIQVRSFVSDVGALELSAKTLTMTDHGVISTLTFDEGNAGALTIMADNISLSGGSQISSSSLVGAGKAGTVEVTAINRLSLTGQGIDDFGNPAPSGIFSTTRADFSDPSFTGDAGTITIAAKTLEVSNGARIDSSSMGYALGNAGQIMVTAPTILINGGSISTSTEFFGNAGAIQINTGSLTVNQGGRLTSNSVIRTIPIFDGEEIPTPTGSAGTITVQGLASPAQSVLIDGSGSGIFTDTQGTGAGGNIFVNANSVTMTNDSSLSASSTGPGNTGNIQIDAGNLFEMTNSSVTTQANLASGGAIKITTNPSGTVELTNSLISASVLNGAGGGGSVNIDPLYVLMQNSQILAQAVQGPGGNITINITNGGLFLPDANSVISASSQFGVNGTVTIQSPNAPVSGQIQPLGKTPLIATSLLNQRCAALAGGEFSSFTLAGRDSLPTEPGSWLTSPLAFGSAGIGDGALAEAGAQARVTDPAHETTVLSLRQIAPAGFLTQNFAVDSSASCQS